VLEGFIGSSRNLACIILTICRRISDREFTTFQEDFSRKTARPKDDLVYLTKASHSLSEELKLYSYLRSQSEEAGSRKARTERLLATLKSIISENPEYEGEVSSITTAIEGIQKDRLILSLADYDASYTKINEQKKIIDAKIALLKSQGFYPVLDLSKLWNQVAFFTFIGLIFIMGYFGNTAFIYGAF